MKKIGTRLQVFRGTAAQTSGGLTRADLVRNKEGKIVSKRKQKIARGKGNNLQKHLRKIEGTKRKR